MRDRAIAWLLTGPVGRLVAFAGDLVAVWWRWAVTKVSRP
jgi:hypothetical protein